MSRAIVGLATALAFLALTGTANAASQVHFKFSGPFAQVLQINLSATSEEITLVNVYSNPFTGATTLNIDQGTTQFDANHNITGFTDTSAFASSGFSFEKTGFANATLTASIPATTCSFDAFGNPLGCNSTTINASLTWAGQAPVQVVVQNDHFNGFGFNAVEHQDGTVRNATVTGTVGDLTLTGSEAPSADFGTMRDGETFVCIGNGC